MLKKIIKIVLLLTIILIGIIFLGVVFDAQLKQDSGFNIYKYKNEKKNSIDVLFLGTSFMYCNYSPMDAYNESGITSYLVAGPEQSMNTTYYNFMKSLDTQSPKAVAIEIKGLTFDDGRTESSQLPVISKYENLAYATKGNIINEQPTTLYNFFTYHTRWKNVDKESVVLAYNYFFGKGNVDVKKGYVYLKDVNKEIKILPDEVSDINENYEKNIIYIDKIVDVCKDKGIEVFFLVTPSAKINYYDKYIENIKARYENKDVVNLNEYLKDMDFDMSTDMYDGGHTNYSGALKCTEYLVGYMKKYSIEDKRNDFDFKNWNKQYEEFKKIIK